MTEFRAVLRGLARDWLANGVIVVSIGLAIGGVASSFSSVYSMLLRPFGFQAEERLFFIASSARDSAEGRPSLAPGNFADLRENQQTFESLGGFRHLGVVVGGEVDQAAPVRAQEVSPGLFRTLGVAPALGRAFGEEDYRAGPWTATILSHRLWTSMFGRDEQVLGQTLRIDGAPVTIVGVMPRGFDLFAGRFDLYLPVSLWGMRGTTQRSHSFLDYHAVGRLAPHVTTDQASAQLRALASRLRSEYPLDNEHLRLEMRTLRDQFGIDGDIRRLALLVQGGMVVVFLIAACSVAHVFVARSHRRSGEFGVRAALGGSSFQLLRPTALEATVLSALGGALGVAATVAGVRLLASSTFFANGVSLRFQPRFDGATLAVCWLLAVVAALFFAAAPALRAARSDPASALRSAAGTASMGRPQRRLMGVFLASQMGLTAVLLVLAGSMTLSHWRHVSTSLGFEPDGVLKVDMHFPFHTHGPSSTPEGKNLRLETARSLLESARSLPGVTSAAIAQEPPGGPLRGPDVQVRRSGAADDEAVTAAQLTASAEYPRLLGLDLRSGRWLNERSPREAVLVEELADAIGCGIGCVGTSVTVDTNRQGSFAQAGDYRVVGVVTNPHRTRGAPTTRPAALYVSALEHPTFFLTLLVRSNAAPAMIAGPVRDAVRTTDVRLPMEGLEPLRSYVRSLSPTLELINVWLVALAPLTLLLATLGCYGVALLLVDADRKEICVRIAMGSTPRKAYLREFRRVAATVILGALAFLPLSIIGVLGLRSYTSSSMALSFDGAVYAVLALLVLGLLSIATAVWRARVTSVAEVLKSL